MKGASAPFSLTMKIQVLQSTLMGGVWHEPGIGNYEPKLAQHLIEIGVAIPKELETKVFAPSEVKASEPKKSLSASQLAPA